MSPRDSKSKGPTQRQLRVGEELRHAISGILFRNELHEPEFETISITVSEVRISPDLKNATVYITPLAGGDRSPKTVDRLNLLAPVLRRVLSKHIVLRHIPKLYFKLDHSFDAAGRVLQLLNSEEVLRDVSKSEE